MASEKRRYGYFVLQASALVKEDAGEFTGVVEDLTTGAKQPFGSLAEITQMMATWASEGALVVKGEA